MCGQHAILNVTTMSPCPGFAFRCKESQRELWNDRFQNQQTIVLCAPVLSQPKQQYNLHMSQLPTSASPENNTMTPQWSFPKLTRDIPMCVSPSVHQSNLQPSQCASLLPHLHSKYPRYMPRLPTSGNNTTAPVWYFPKLT
jgi:hypothetical protein